MMTAWMSGQPLENTEALLEAVEHSNEASIKALLSQGADPNSKTQTGQTMLMSAASKGHLEVVKKFIKINTESNG